MYVTSGCLCISYGFADSIPVRVQSLAFGLIRLIPCAIDTVNMGQKALDTSVTTSIKLYAEFCIPSPFFPTFPPTCRRV
ncbi:hypothetical protein C8R44DRAFT_780859 [Mycena epipterygia]|nr:hypothetical protein C8R44DRAFT_780859 [Mycena epipterygia]